MLHLKSFDYCYITSQIILQIALLSEALNVIFPQLKMICNLLLFFLLSVFTTPQILISLCSFGQKKSKTFVKKFRLHRFNLAKLIKNNKLKKVNLSPKINNLDLKAVFNMNAYQQKHFLEIYGPEKNPVFLAKKAYKQNFRKKKSKLKKKIDQMNLNKSSKMSLNSIRSTYSSIMLNDSFENLDKNIKEFLDNPLLSKSRIKEDFSGGLGRSDVVKLRKLIYKQNYPVQSENEENLIDLPEITVNIYTVSRVISQNCLNDQIENLQDSTKLILLPSKKHK